MDRKLRPESGRQSNAPKLDVTGKSFHWHHERERHGNRKTAEGIRPFAADTVKLQQFIATRLKP